MIKKNKILSAVMLSTIILASSVQLAPVTAFADSTDDKIAQQDSNIATAQSGAAQAKAQQDALQKQVDSANTQLQKLATESQKTSSQIVTLNNNIKERKVSLASQARSAQMNGGATSYINTILNAKSITDAVQKITAMTEVVSANNDMMKQQEQDEKSMQAKLADNAKAYTQATQLQQQLTVQQADLKVAQLNYQATIATAQDQKDSLLAQKAQAQAAAQKVQQQQAAIKSASAASNSANNKSTTPTPNPTPPTPNPIPPTPTPNPPHSIVLASYGNPYPYGQCTWGAYQYMQQYFGVTIPTYAGNAGDWIVYANSGAAAGTIAVFSPAQAGNAYGHVAVVLSVSGGNMTIVEANYAGTLFNERTIPISSAEGFIRP